MILWRMELLGGLRVACQDTVVTRFRTQRAALLLAYLCLHPRQHSRDELCDIFWSESHIEDARTSLRQALSQIRHAFKDAELDHETLLHFDGNHTVGVWGENITTDVAEFRKAVKSAHWAQAKKLYLGPLLPGFWDDWLLDERDTLAALYETVCQHDGEESEETARLPEELNRFFGRQAEIAKLREMLQPPKDKGAGNRLVTLLGTGGVGKTRLAVALGQTLAPVYDQRVVFIPLAELTDTRFLLSAIREGLEIPAQANADPLDQVAEFVGTKPFLLILDNLEQLAATASAPLSALLKRVPSLTLLATSRRRLGIAGEKQFTVPPLEEEEGVPLFCDRASVVPDAPIANLCQLLEGIPLAIELAAARVGTLTVAEMIDNIGERLTLLATQQADKSERHRSLHATMDWSVRLLTSDQRQFFAALSVFRGGWTKEAAVEICEEPAALEYLSQLRDRSLVFSEESETGIRWRMLESLREFGQEMITMDRWEHLIARHGAFFRDFLDKGRAGIVGSDPHIALAHDAEHDNFRVILERGSSIKSIKATEICGLLIPFWDLRNYYAEAKIWLEHFYKAEQQPTSERLLMLRKGALIFYNCGNMSNAEKWARESIVIAKEIGSLYDIIATSRGLADILIDKEELNEAQCLLEETLLLLKKEQDTDLETECRGTLGWLLKKRKDYPNARKQLEQGVSCARLSKRVDNLSTLLHRLAAVCLEMSDWHCARKLAEENIQIQSRKQHGLMLILGHTTRGVAAFHEGDVGTMQADFRFALDCLVEQKNPHLSAYIFSLMAPLYFAQKDYGTTSVLIGCFQKSAELSGVPDSDEDIENCIQNTRVILSKNAYETSVAKGQAMSLEESVAFAQNALASL
jgi:predicted ATPase